jgi:hypothetical protein
MKNPEIYIVNADKGGRTVIWKRSDYISEANRQLADTGTYLEVSKEEADQLYEALRKERDQVIQQLLWQGHIKVSEAERIREQGVKIPRWYMLPKIHKSKREDTGTFAGRPITSAIGGMMKTLDEFAADTTSPLLRRIPGSLIDTMALLNEVDKLDNISPDSKLCSADVEGLYTNMPHKETLDVSAAFYSHNLPFLYERAAKEGILPPPSPALFRKILELVLTWNIFSFQESRFFLQVKGTAMGCSMSVFMANVLMYHRTRHIIERPPIGLHCFKRYIDDLFFLWDGPLEDVPGLFSGAIDKDIRLTYEFGGKKLNVLDVTLQIEPDGKLSSTLYRKPTEGHQFVHWSSAHKKSLKSSIPYAQLLRIRRNCSKDDDFKREAAILLERFRSRGYPESVCTEAMTKAAEVDRKTLLVPKVAGELNRLIFVTDNLGSAQGAINENVRTFYTELLDLPLITDANKVYGLPIPEDPPLMASRVGKKLGSSLGPIYKNKQIG